MLKKSPQLTRDWHNISVLEDKQLFYTKCACLSANIYVYYQWGKIFISEIQQIIATKTINNIYIYFFKADCNNNYVADCNNNNVNCKCY